MEAGLSNEVQLTGSYDAVLSLVESDIIGGQQCLSMETLMIEYNGSPGNRQARNKLRDRLQKSYEDRLVFLSPEYHLPQIVISKECLHSQVTSRNSLFFRKATVTKSANILREIVLKHLEEAKSLPWPPTVENLNSIDSQYPELLNEFMKMLLSSKDSNHSCSVRVNRIADSFCQDIVYAISKGKYLTLKHRAPSPFSDH